MCGLVEMQGALSWVVSHGRFFCLAGGEQAGGGESLWLAATWFLGRTVGFARFVPH